MGKSVLDLASSVCEKGRTAAKSWEAGASNGQ